MEGGSPRQLGHVAGLLGGERAGADQICHVEPSLQTKGKQGLSFAGLAQGCDYSSASAMELLQSCTKPSILSLLGPAEQSCCYFFM